jgi:hypothetical protein
VKFWLHIVLHELEWSDSYLHLLEDERDVPYLPWCNDRTPEPRLFYDWVIVDGIRRGYMMDYKFAEHGRGRRTYQCFVCNFRGQYFEYPDDADLDQFIQETLECGDLPSFDELRAEIEQPRFWDNI